MNQKKIVRIAIIFCIVSIIGLLLSLQAYSLSQKEKEKPMGEWTWGDTLIANLGFVYIWSLSSPIILKLGRRYPLTGNRVFRKIGIHFAAASVITAVLMLTLSAFLWTFVLRFKNQPAREIYSNAYREFAGDFIMGLLIYCIVLGIGQMLFFYGKYRERKFKASQLQARLAEAELETLKMQLHPSYLFNTLSSISNLVREDLDAADRMIARLGDFLRLTLDTAGSREVTLQQEIDYLKCYLEIERIRENYRLHIDLVTEPETLDWLMPALIIQPIVESVFQFSTIRGTERHDLLVETSFTDEDPRRQNLQVRLKGKTYTDSTWKENPELKNTRQRLQQIYGTEYSLELAQDPNGNREVLLSLPLLPNVTEKTA